MFFFIKNVFLVDFRTLFITSPANVVNFTSSYVVLMKMSIRIQCRTERLGKNLKKFEKPFHVLTFYNFALLGRAHSKRAKMIRVAPIDSKLFGHNQNTCKVIDPRTLIRQHQHTTRQKKTCSVLIGLVLFFLRAKHEKQKSLVYTKSYQ